MRKKIAITIVVVISLLALSTITILGTNVIKPMPGSLLFDLRSASAVDNPIGFKVYYLDHESRDQVSLSAVADVPPQESSTVQDTCMSTCSDWPTCHYKTCQESCHGTCESTCFTCGSTCGSTCGNTCGRTCGSKLTCDTNCHDTGSTLKMASCGVIGLTCDPFGPMCAQDFQQKDGGFDTEY